MVRLHAAINHRVRFVFWRMSLSVTRKHLKFLFNETAMNYGANSRSNTPEYEAYTTNRSV
jgi:hypothetical protein